MTQPDDIEVTPFVGRNRDLEQLRRWIAGRGWTAGEKVNAVSIEGPGGVGKSTLFRRALDPADLAARGYLVADIAGQADPENHSVFSWVEKLVDAASSRLEPGRSAFRSTRQCLRYHYELLMEVERELRAKEADEEQIAAARTWFGVARLGLGALRRDIRGLVSHQTRDDLEWIWKSIRSTAALQANAWDRLVRPLKNEMRRAPLRALALALVSDFERLFDGKGVKGIQHERLLLVLDDYEGLSEVLGRFLTAELLPRLRVATFETLLIVLGRDDLRMTDTAWEDTLAPVLGDRRLVLRPLDAEEIVELCRLRGIDDPAVAQKIHAESHGFPWLVDILVGDLGADETGPITSYRRFVQRMARFMTDRERGWFEALCFLDAVNYASIALVLPDEDPELVMEWFINEQSIRSYTAELWKVWPYIRHRVLLYRWSIDPTGCEALAQKTGMQWRPGRSADLL